MKSSLSVKIRARSLLVLALAVGLAGCGGGAQETPEAAVARYVKAAQARDFNTLYEMDYMPQRQKVLAYRGGEQGLAERLDDNFKKARESFETTTELVGFSSAWAEKFLFVPDMTYAIGGAETKALADNPTRRYGEREAAIIDVLVEYTDQAKAPSHGSATIRKIVYQVKLMPLADIVKGLKTDMNEAAWVVRGIEAQNDTIEYW